MRQPHRPFISRPAVPRPVALWRMVAFYAVEVALEILRRAREVEVVLVESGDVLKVIHGEQGKPAVLQGDELAAAELLEHAVDVHRGQAERVGELDLRQRQPDRVVFGRAPMAMCRHTSSHRI